MAVILDLKKAYDLIWTNGIIFELQQMGIKGRTLGWISDFLTRRLFQVKVSTSVSDKRFILILIEVDT